MKNLVLLAMFSVVFAACGSDSSNKPTAPNTNNTSNPTTNNSNNKTADLSALSTCPNEAFAAYERFIEYAGRVSSYFDQNGQLTPAGQGANVNGEIEVIKSSCQTFTQNYSQVSCKGTSAQSGLEKAVIGADVVKDCDIAIRYLAQLGR